MKLYVRELLSTIPSDVLKVCQTLHEHGFRSWLVGGCLRDYFLKQKFSDIDLATDAIPSDIQSIFPNTEDIGSSYGTVLVKEGSSRIEITTLRVESGYGDNRHPDKIAFCKDIKTDLGRRDFTINGLAYNPIKKEVVDYYAGLDDLHNRLIKTIGAPSKRFSEDALRLIRACRFVAQLNFELEENTFMALQENGELLANISRERIAKEFKKLLSAKWADEGLMVMRDTGLLDHTYPVLNKLDESAWDEWFALIKLSDPELRVLIMAWSVNKLNNQ